ncbi:MAG: rRNA pseudouridine synthase [Actinobacteria bacterium]|nr:rRNA pseudouridine synthase [Actinomycetota bacterium]
MKIRIAKFLANSGLASRRKAESLILSGKIRVNGKPIKDFCYKIEPGDKVEYSGKLIKPQSKIVLALNKPAGYVSTVKDEYNRKKVLDLVSDLKQKLFPVGRLDSNSKGLIFLTNDGDFAYKVTHPKFQIPKTYMVEVDKMINTDDISKIKNGINIEGRELIPASIEILKNNKGHSVIEIKIIEGRKRIIRKAFLKLGYNVIELKRIQVGGFKLGGLKEGNYRILDNKDIESVIKPYG